MFVFLYIADFYPCIEPSLDVCRERNVSSRFIFLETVHKCLFLPVASWETFKGRLQINSGKTNFLALGSGTQYVYRMEMEGHRQDSSLPNSIMHLFPPILEQCRSLLYLCCDERIESGEACVSSQGTDNPTQKGNSFILFPALAWKG